MSQEGGDAQEKIHDATPRRLEQAHERGDMARSLDLHTFAAYVGLALGVALTGGWAAVRIGEGLQQAFAHPQVLADAMLHGGHGTVLPQLGARLGSAVLPVLTLPAVLILMLLIAQRGIVIAPDKVMPKLSRLSPIDNAKQKYGVHGLVEFAKSVVKVVAVGVVMALVVMAEFDRLPFHAGKTPRALGALLADLFWAVMTGVLIVSAAIALFDVIWQRVEFLGRQRMSQQELREEAKQAEGDPHIRAQRRERARQIATNRMMSQVPGADVVIANPVHYAVALKWDRAQGGAPVCLAKGVDEIALRIREIAEAEGIPVHIDPPTARSLHALVEIGQEVPPDHYRAVAAAILFAEQMRRRASRA